MSVSSNKIIGFRNISKTDVTSTIGCPSSDESVFCNYHTINQWSFYKPVRYNSGGEPLVDADFYRVNDGFSIAGGVGYYQYPSQLVKAITNNTAWIYEKPGQSNCRYGDFRGYSHLAKPWFTANLSPAEQKIGQSFKYYYVADNPDLKLPAGVTMSLMWLLNNFDFLRGFGNGSTQAKDLYSLCLIYSTSQTPNSCMVQKVEKVLTILGDEENLLERGISVKVPTDLVAGTTYYVIPCIGNIPTSVIADADPLEDARAISISEMQGTIAQCFFYPIPTQLIQFKALEANSIEGTILSYLTLTMNAASSATLSKNTFSGISVSTTASISSSYTGSGHTIVVEMYVDGVYTSGNNIGSVKIATLNFNTMRGGGNVTRTASYSGSLEKVGAAKDEQLAVRCEITATYGANSYKDTRTLYIENINII